MLTGKHVVFTPLVFLSLLHAFAQEDSIFRFLNSRYQPSTEQSSQYATKYVIKKTKEGIWNVRDYDILTGKLLMNSSFKDSLMTISSGLFEVFSPEGKILISGRYKDNLRQGSWRKWHPNGVLSDSLEYDNQGNISGTRKGWYSNGKIRDSAFYKNNGSARQISWHPNGVKRAEGMMINEEKTGKWFYYFKSGTKASEETYIKDSVVEIHCFDETGKAITGNCLSEKIAEFPGGMDAWRKYLADKVKAYQKMLKTEGGEGTVVVSFIIGTDGKVEEAVVENAKGNYLEDFALQIIYTSPKWQHATQHNIPVQTYYRQPITFKHAD